MYYPEEFPPQARARVEAVKIKAGREFDSAPTEPSYDAIDGHRLACHEAGEGPLLRYVLRIFLAFVTEARALKLWPIDEMQRQCDSFLTGLAYWEPIEKNCAKIAAASWDGMSMSIPDGVRRRMESTPEWQTYVDWMLSDAEQQSEAPGVGLSDIAPQRPQTWSEIQITFLSDHRVEIRSSGKTETHNYGELGFEDRRRGASSVGKPNGAWMMLCELAQAQGNLGRPPAGKQRASAQKRIQWLRRQLRAHFGIDADPTPFNGVGYQTTFKVGCGPSFET